MGIFSTGRKIGLDTVLQRKEGLLFNKLDGELVMLSVQNSQYYGMDKIGAKIWELIETPKSLKSLVSDLLSHYEVSEEKCTQDTIEFLLKLDEKKLIILSES
jgi:hypothetical protein